MEIAQQITGYAIGLFDVVGASQLPSGEGLLIVGLESTPNRNLDDFGHRDGDFHLYGFETFVSCKLESLLAVIHGEGFSAELIGEYGYPRHKEADLKEEAIRAGIGRRGKSTLVLHPKFGPWLRFMGIRTDAPLEPLIVSIPIKGNDPICDGCSICIDVCPVKALEPYTMPDRSLCLSNISIMAEENGRLVPCDLCLSRCPAGKK